MDYTIKKAQMDFWVKHGYVMLRDFVKPEVKPQLTTWCQEVTNWPEAPGKWMKYFEDNVAGKKQLCRIENILDYHSHFNELATSDRTLKLISSLMSETAVIFKEKINYKLPNGNGFKPHQDAPAFISFNQTFHITMMIAIDACTRENGCLQVLKQGTNQQIILPQEQDGSICHTLCTHYDWLPLECQPGDCILFHSYLPHYSEANHSDKARRVMFMTYNKLSEGGSMREAYFRDKREKFPPDCERDPNKDYAKGASIYNVANPITT